MARLLVLGDDPPSLRALRKLLEFDGHTVLCASSGAGAIELLRSGEAFDAVLTDLRWESPEGNAVARAARELHPDACVYVCSTTAGPERARLAGACSVMGRPLDYDGMMASLLACRSCATCRDDQRCHGRLHAGALPTRGSRR